MTFDQWFQLRLDSLRRQNEWRKIDCLLASKEYVRDAFNYAPEGYALVPVEPTARMLMDGSEWTESASMATGCYRAMLSAAPKETK